MDDTGAATTAATHPGPANLGAFWLSLIGLFIQGTAFVAISAIHPPSSGVGGMMGFGVSMMYIYYGVGGYGSSAFWFAASLVALAFGVLGVFWMKSNLVATVRKGSVLVLVAAIAGFLVMWGFWIGAILMFLGGVVGLATVQREGRGES